MKTKFKYVVSDATVLIAQMIVEIEIYKREIILIINDYRIKIILRDHPQVIIIERLIAHIVNVMDIR